MSKEPDKDEMRDEYEFRDGVRGKYVSNAGWDEAWLAELERRERAAGERDAQSPEWSEVRSRILALLGKK